VGSEMFIRVRDYLAKDFLSFRQALFDFSAQRYPEWKERSESDFGVMFLEALSALADDLSYTQDRIAAEAHLETATQRRSLVRHARLLDYEPRPQVSARVTLQFDVAEDGPIPAGVMVSAQRPDGLPIDFETGTGLDDPQAQYEARARWNREKIVPYLWDQRQACLKAGATSMWVKGHGFCFTPGQSLLIETRAAAVGDPPLQQIVQLVSQQEVYDRLREDAPVTRITWRPEDGLKQERDQCRTLVIGNLVPATHGRRWVENFAIGSPPRSQPQTEPTVWRTGANHRGQYLYTLQQERLAWLAPEDPQAPPLPEIRLVQVKTGRQTIQMELRWQWVRSLLEAKPDQNAFTVDPARYRLNGAGQPGALIVHDYDGDAGDTIRFGDGDFGALPDPGTVFQVTYRAGGGKVGNVAPDSINRLDNASATALGLDPTRVRTVTNPFAARGGEDPETAERIRRLAPEAFRARPLRAVRPEDYQAAAETLPWVRRAGSQGRWVGSWMAYSTAAAPRGSDTLSKDRAQQFADRLNRRRLAGHEAYALAPRYVPLDLQVVVRASPDAFRTEVQQAVLVALGPAQPAQGIRGFFDDDHFTFGTPLERLTLDPVLRTVPGVVDVLAIRYRRAGRTGGFIDLPPVVSIGRDELLRVENDPHRPTEGSLRVFVEGGK
jgi:hypothetical protein